MVEFEKKYVIKKKIYLFDCIVYSSNYCPIIIITHDECTFLINNSIQKAWIRKKDTFLWPKDQKQSIMKFEFFFLFGRLNLFSLTLEKKEQGKDKIRLVEKKAVEIFEYRNINNEYWNRAKLYKQVIDKVLPIAQLF